MNLSNSRFEKDLNEVISRAKENHIQHLLVTGTNIVESQKALALCQQYPDYLSCTAGVHPHDADNVSENYLENLEELGKVLCG